MIVRALKDIINSSELEISLVGHGQRNSHKGRAYRESSYLPFQTSWVERGLLPPCSPISREDI
jgi:hypothetical protein